MPRFSLTLTDEYGQGYSVWESDDLQEAREQVDSLEAALDEARQPRSYQLEAMISDLRDQIYDAEGDEAPQYSETMHEIADLVYPEG
jgi:hypothetical protein